MRTRILTRRGWLTHGARRTTTWACAILMSGRWPGGSLRPGLRRARPPERQAQRALAAARLGAGRCPPVPAPWPPPPWRGSCGRRHPRRPRPGRDLHSPKVHRAATIAGEIEVAAVGRPGRCPIERGVVRDLDTGARSRGRDIRQRHDGRGRPQQDQRLGRERRRCERGVPEAAKQAREGTYADSQKEPPHGPAVWHGFYSAARRAEGLAPRG